MPLTQPTTPETPDQQQTRDKKANQARINGRKSKGPTTAQGKWNSSRSAIRHGLTANVHTLLTTESPAEYDEVYNAFVDSLRPADKAEMRLVEKIANLDWRLERFVMMETCLLNIGAEIHVEEIAARFERIDGIGFIVEAWKETCSASHCADLLRRYMGTLQTQFNATLKNFRDLEKHRLARVQSGRNIDEECGLPYKPPVLETLLPSRVATPQPEAPPPALTLVPPPIPKEPTTIIKMNQLPRPSKHPAA